MVAFFDILRGERSQVSQSYLCYFDDLCQELNADDLATIIYISSISCESLVIKYQ